jgi:Tfp pilus assembly protein PilN
MAASQKNDFNKKDMNFFSEFTTSGSQVVSSFAIVLLIFALVLVYAMGTFLFNKIKMDNTQKKIDAIQGQIDNEATKAKLDAYSQLKLDVDENRTYLYVLKQLDIRQGEYLHADTIMMDTIAKSIPGDIAITGLTYEEGQVVISGSAATAAAPLQMVEILQDLNTFYYVSIDQIETIDQTAIENLSPEELAIIDRFFFTFTGSLESSYNVTYTRILDNSTQSPLDTPTVMALAAGETYSIPDINSFTYDGKTYTLTRILINGNKPTTDDMQRFIDANAVTGRATTKTDVKLYYQEQAPKKEGDAK